MGIQFMFWWVAVFLIAPHVSASDPAKTPSTSAEEWWKGLSLMIHRNGEPDPCGSAIPAVSSKHTIQESSDKYELESILTDIIAESLQEEKACLSPDNVTAEPDGLYGFCDMGPDRTPILLDHKSLKAVQRGSLPCRWYTREGVRITSLEQLQTLAAAAKQASSGTCANPQDASGGNAELHLYGVQAGRVFMFAPSYVGEIFDLSHMAVVAGDDKRISMEVLSLEPRVFDIFNVFMPEEADALVDRALKETSPTHKIKRSTTGTSENSIFNKRTSENAFDTHGKTALDLKRRIFELLGFDEYWHGHDDGLQILRYNTSKAYVQHMDYMTDPSGKELFNYDSAAKGGNRFATVLLYMSDSEEGAGGETVFSEAWPPELDPSERKPISEATNELRRSGDARAAGIAINSWEEKMVATCRSKLSVRPSRGRAVLFYSQYPNGKPDPKSRHGGCPVLNDQPKWAANLWVWNTPRNDQNGAPLREDLLAKGYKPPETNKPRQLTVTFKNLRTDPTLKKAELWFDEAMFWGKLGHGDPPHRVNTYTGHRWNLRVDGEIVKEW
eukprot:CAMPEP_0117043808 /NCGR_PEP_ID=MMETSP0472-20121206/30420_1 /TAXON_ID=693140 ORGANISM="Tiarina fusus, Strain LIS" /NCGR_SAMPLE_ID=MMETSP0472 /ASSEMBLY_ACC=CAM_ASM_000603 /LENGTH=555 /DNA_ID=CAMNT_0004755411 /DNA_START=79 /DNA_END=1744 /DNA_ORIENTATION=-